MLFYQRTLILFIFLMESFVSHAKALRIASGSIASDEILWELLSRAERSNELVAVSSLWGQKPYSRFENNSLPESVQSRVGDNLESIIQLKPDIVFLASYNRPELVFQLKKSGIKVISQDRFGSLEDIYRNIIEIGEATKTQLQARELVAQMKQSIKQINQWHKKHTPGTTYINYSSFGSFMGKNTSFHAIVESLAGQNLSAQQGIVGWAKLSDERLVGLNPDFIITSYSEASAKKAILEQLRNTPWKHLDAVKKGRILFVDEKNLLAVSQHIVEAIDDIHQQVKEALEKTSTKGASLEP